MLTITGEPTDQARESKAQELKQTIEEGFKNYNAGNHFVYQTIGSALTHLNEDKYYKELGYETIDQAIKEMGKSRSICYAMMDYDKFITPLLADRPELMQISVTNLCKYFIPRLRVLDTPTGFTDEGRAFLYKMSEIAALPDGDQKDEIRRIRGKKTHVDCEHGKTEAWVKCLDCGKFIRVT